MSVADSGVAAIILAAGMGTRMRSDRPKVMHHLAGRPIVAHVARAAATRAGVIVVVVGPGMDEVAGAVRVAAPGCEVRVAIQAERRGTGDAVRAARGVLGAFAGDVLVLLGDVPLIRAATIERIIAARRAAMAGVAVVGMRPPVPGAYGRMVVAADGTLARIVEAREATADELALDLCNSGLIDIDGAVLPLVEKITNANAKGEFYLTDIVALARAAGRTAISVEAPYEELVGINTPEELAAAEALYHARP